MFLLFFHSMVQLTFAGETLYVEVAALHPQHLPFAWPPTPEALDALPPCCWTRLAAVLSL